MITSLCQIISIIHQFVLSSLDSQWNGAKSVAGSRHDGFRFAYMMNGMTTIIIQPATSTVYHTALLPVSICPGGMKLRTKASKDPANPTVPITHIRALPLPIRNGRGLSFILYLKTIAAANISMYIIRYSRMVSCDNIW